MKWMETGQRLCDYPGSIRIDSSRFRCNTACQQTKRFSSRPYAWIHGLGRTHWLKAARERMVPRSVQQEDIRVPNIQRGSGHQSPTGGAKVRFGSSRKKVLLICCFYLRKAIYTVLYSLRKFAMPLASCSQCWQDLMVSVSLRSGVVKPKLSRSMSRSSAWSG
jgi:hypothetical protein